MLSGSPRQVQRQSEQEAALFLAAMAERSGLLYAHAGGYSFGDHLTVQEYLAARYLVDNLRTTADWRAFLQAHAGQSWWLETFLLMAGCLLEKAGAGPPLPAGRAGQAARRRRRPRLRPGLGRPRPARDPAPPRRLARQRPRRAGPPPAGRPLAQPAHGLRGRPHRRRRSARPIWAIRASQAHTCSPSSSPSPPASSGWAATPPRWRGSRRKRARTTGKHEAPRHQVALSAFALARYPTTNAMFRRFVEAGGYADKRWWPEAIADRRWAKGKVKDYAGERTQPAYWDDARFNNPSQPVVGVTWYEAAAYCRWLTATLNDGHLYRLPTEAEWERAARGPSPSPVATGEGRGEGNRYPWGDDWQPKPGATQRSWAWSAPRRSASSPTAPAPKACSTWPATSGNGAAIGSTRTPTAAGAARLRETRPGRTPGRYRCCAAARGTMTAIPCGALTGAGTALTAGRQLRFSCRQESLT